MFETQLTPDEPAGEPYQDDHLLEIDGLTKQYGDLKAVDDVTLSIEPGEIFALLGPNGAGKTTLISCVTGMITHFDGDVSVAGYDVLTHPSVTRRLVGLVPQELKYDAFFTVRDSLRYQGGFFGVPPNEQRIDELLEAFSLKDKEDENTRWLSGGMQRRLMICKALMHDPVLLFLDEPTAGVDVELREELWSYVRQLRERGTTIVLTTHYIEEAERLADRIGILNRGRLVRVDNKDDLMTEFGLRTVSIELETTPSSSPRDVFGDIDVEITEGRSGMPVVELTYRQGDIAEGQGGTTGGSPVDRVIRWLIEEGCAIRNIEGGRSSLEEIFKELVFKKDGGRREDRRSEGVGRK
jgi:ABC-2 type transport system ATP-binding protein